LGQDWVARLVVLEVALNEQFRIHYRDSRGSFLPSHATLPGAIDTPHPGNGCRDYFCPSWSPHEENSHAFEFIATFHLSSMAASTSISGFDDRVWLTSACGLSVYCLDTLFLARHLVKRYCVGKTLVNGPIEEHPALHVYNR
jgi:hypothetical protein